MILVGRGEVGKTAFVTDREQGEFFHGVSLCAARAFCRQAERRSKDLKTET